MAKVQIDRPTAGERVKVRKIDRNAPDLDTMFEDEGDPLELVEYDDENLEASAESEMSEIVRQIKADKKARYERFRIEQNKHYYLMLCFQSRDQRDEFAQATGWATVEGRFVNGLDVARRLGVDIEAFKLEPVKGRGKPHLYSREEVLP